MYGQGESKKRRKVLVDFVWFFFHHMKFMPQNLLRRYKEVVPLSPSGTASQELTLLRVAGMTEGPA